MKCVDSSRLAEYGSVAAGFENNYENSDAIKDPEPLIFFLRKVYQHVLAK